MAISGAASLCLGSIKEFPGITIFSPVQISTTQTHIVPFLLPWIFFFFFLQLYISSALLRRAYDLDAFMHSFIYEQMVEKCVCMAMIG